MKIDIWADVICPFCFIGTRHLELALQNAADADDVELVWHSFELDPGAPVDQHTDVVNFLASKHGMSLEQAAEAQRQVAAKAAEAGLTFNWQQAKPGNTLAAHRLVHLAARHGRSTQAEKALMHAYFTDGVAISDPAALQGVGESIGLPADEVAALLSGDEFTDAVRADEQLAAQIGVQGVPFFVFDEKWAVSGAQPVELFEQAIATAREAAPAPDADRA